MASRPCSAGVPLVHRELKNQFTLANRAEKRHDDQVSGPWGIVHFAPKMQHYLQTLPVSVRFLDRTRG